MDLEGKIFDRYDMASFLYGWIVALQENPRGDTAGASNCFLASFELVQQTDYFLADLDKFSSKWFDVVAYTPTHVAGNYAAAYE